MPEKNNDNINQDLFLFETTGYSMWPFIRAGEKLIIKKIPIKNLKTGDIILYNDKGKRVCHRIIKMLKDKQKYLLYTRGDSSTSSPELVEEQMYIGKLSAKIKNNKLFNIRSYFLNRCFIFICPWISVLSRKIRPLCVKFIKNKYHE